MSTKSETESDDTDLQKATRELDELFPGAELDESLEKHFLADRLTKAKKKARKKTLVKTLLHGLFYGAFVSFFYFKIGLGAAASMMWGLSYLVFYFGFILPASTVTRK